jgi:outer membrane protein TolC
VGVRESRVSYWPEIRAGFQVGRNEQGPRTESLFRLGGFESGLFSRFNLGLSLPIFSNFFGCRVAMARAEVMRQSGEDDLREARLEAERATRSALLALRDRWDGLRIQERSLAIATEALELSREEYRLGTRTFEALPQSVSAGETQRRQLIQARNGVGCALIDLEAAVGDPITSIVR